jgi:hypothetical protein
MSAEELSMELVRAGAVLFVSVIAASTAIGCGILYLSNYGTPPSLEHLEGYLTYILHFSAVSLATAIVLVVLARRGRRQPLGDGVIAINVSVLAYSFLQLIVHAISGPSPYPDSMNFLFLMMVMGGYLLCLVPAYMLAYLVLRRTPLLRGLAPP